MKIRHSCFLFIVLLVSLLGATAMACSDPECPPCLAWNGSHCVWDCGPTDSCCDDECWGKPCCNGDTEQCQTSAAVCCGFPTTTCCDNVCCYSECCDPGEACCGTQCWGGLCCNDTQCDPSDTVCCGAVVGCCEGECCNDMSCCGKTPGGRCCDNLACYNSATQKCCGNGDGLVCDNDETCCGGQCCETGPFGLFCDNGDCVTQCDSDACKEPENGYCVYQCGPGAECVDGECLYCWSLEEHPDASGTCACSEATGHCGDSIQAWSISTCERSATGYQSCSTTYRQVGSEYACDETTDWVNLFLCYGGQAAQCVAICAAESALCVESGFDPAGCSVGAIHCYECLEKYVEDPDDCDCLTVFCNIGDVTAPIMNVAGTLSGGACTSE